MMNNCAIKSLFVFVITVFSNMVLAVDLPERISDVVYSETLGSVKVYRDGWPMSNPIIELNSDQVLLLSFDDLVPEKRDYMYTIFHCDRNWRKSFLPQQEYLPSFTDFPIIDFANSLNTNIHYINYQVRIPNDDVPIKYSGNYALVVFDRNEPEDPVLIRRFFVVENKVKIGARIHRALFESYSGKNQEVDVTVNHSGFPIQNPYSDVKLVITQNNRSDNAITELEPLYVQNNQLIYDFDHENLFVGGTEFRYFEVRGVKYPGEGVIDISYRTPLYHATIETAEPRVKEPYRYYREMNGRYYIEAYNIDDSDIEAEYMKIHLSLAMDNVLMGGGIYVFGELSNWQCNADNRMSWNPNKNQYEIEMLLKQGYYNYIYVWMDDSDRKIKSYNIEGNSPDAENDYQVYFYYGRKSDRYDQLIGYQVFNSLTDRN